MRGRTAIVIGLSALVAAGVAATRLLSDAASTRPSTEPPAAETPKDAHPLVHRTPRRRATAPEPPVDVDAELQAAWDAALVLYKGGDPTAALTGPVQWRKDRPDWFAEASRAKTLAEM